MSEFLRSFTNIRREEIAPTLASAAFFFCILTALMVVRPARESLGVEQGIDTVRWLFIGTAVVTLAVNPIFGWLVSRFERLAFISATYLFFAASLVAFWALLVTAPETIGNTTGRVFYVWFSVFNLFVTMVFWALMADRFSLEQSKRLYGPIAVGGTLGAIFGPWLAWGYVDQIGTPALLLIAVGFLVVAVALAGVVARLQPSRARGTAGDPDAPPAADARAVIGGSAWEGFRAVFRSPYLLSISAYVLILAIVATFIYFTRLQMVDAMSDSVDSATGLFAQIDLWTQIATLVLQALVAGHLMKRFGVSVTLALLPITVALGFMGLALMTSFVVLVLFEATFRAVQRAIMRPARETLFTVVSREDKYKSKAFIDTFVYRGGDVVGAQTEGLLGGLGLGLMGLAMTVVPLAAVWTGLGVWLGRAQERMAEETGHARPAPVPPRRDNERSGTPG